MNGEANNFLELVTFIIPSRRIDDLLLNCVSKIEALYPGAAIIAVLDEEARAAGGQFSAAGGALLLYSANTNISAKRNLGSASAKSKYLAFLDSDAYPNEGWLENGLEFLETHPEYGLATGLQKNFPADSQMARTIRRLRLSPLFTARSLMPFYEDGRKNNMDCRIVVGANLLVRKEMYFKVGGMNENLYVSEDGDFSSRFNLAGIKMALVPAMTVCHRERELWPFLRQRYTFSYSLPLNLLKGKNVSFHLMAMAPLWGVFILTAQAFLLNSFGIGLAWLLFFPALVLLLLSLESLRLGRNMAESARLLFLFICVYAVWTLSIIWGLFRLPPKPRKVYFHK